MDTENPMNNLNKKHIFLLKTCHCEEFYYHYIADLQVCIVRINDKKSYGANVLRKSEDFTFLKNLCIEGHKNERVHFIMLPLNFETNA